MIGDEELLSCSAYYDIEILLVGAKCQGRQIFPLTKVDEGLVWHIQFDVKLMCKHRFERERLEAAGLTNLNNTTAWHHTFRCF